MIDNLLFITVNGSGLLRLHTFIYSMSRAISFLMRRILPSVNNLIPSVNNLITAFFRGHPELIIFASLRWEGGRHGPAYAF